MFGWLANKNKAKERPLNYYNRGRYLHKPVIGRALCVVVETTAPRIEELINSQSISINGEIICARDLDRRLESGNYSVTILDENARYEFYID